MIILLLVQRRCELLDLFHLLGMRVLYAAVKASLVAFRLAAAEMRFADMGSHHFAGRGDFKSFCGSFVCL